MLYNGIVKKGVKKMGEIIGSVILWAIIIRVIVGGRM